MTEILLRIVYVANILVAGWISITALFYPQKAIQSIFENAYQATEVVRLVGALWLGIAVLSVFGLWKPVNFSPVLILQLIYKGSWLLVVALPALQNKAQYPTGMSVFFLIWVCALPFVIPWKTLFQ